MIKLSTSNSHPSLINKNLLLANFIVGVISFNIFLLNVSFSSKIILILFFKEFFYGFFLFVLRFL